MYRPSRVETDRPLPVVVGIHGFGGSGRDCWSLWQSAAEEHGFLLVCPSLADAQGGWHQRAGEIMVERILAQVAQAHRVERRVVLVGFSAGAQFVQGYAFHHPQTVAGLVVLAAGTYYRPPAAVAKIPVRVIIGDRDDPIAIAGAQEFVRVLDREGFPVDLHILPGVGHAVTTDAQALTGELAQRVFNLP